MLVFGISLLAALLKGGAVAGAGYIGACLARSTMNIFRVTSDYIYFDKENGFNADHPEEKADLADRGATVIKEGFDAVFRRKEAA